jgi:hypothetical protein
VTRTLAWPARRDASVTSIPQVFSAVVQNTCRRLCQVHRDPLSAPRHPVAR